MINFRLSPNGAEVEVILNGISSWKSVSINDLVKVLNQVVLEQEEETIKSPTLPIGTIGYIEQNHNSYVVLMYREPRITSITFETRTYQVGYPGLIYSFAVRNKFLIDTCIYAVKERITKPSTELFRYPYFNSFSNGRICMGSNRIPIEELWQLHKLPDILSAMPATNGTPINNLSGLTGDSLLKAVEEKPFPNEWLTPMELKLKNLF